MKNQLLISSGILIAFLNLTGCGDNSNSDTVAPVETANPTATETPTQTSPANPPEKSATQKLAPGTYCYKANTNTINAGAKVTINSNNKVSGEIKGKSDLNAIGEQNNYSRTFQGTITGNRAKLTTETRIEVEILNSQDNWAITESSLITDKATYNKADCSTLNLNLNIQDDSAIYDDNTGNRKIRIKFDRGATSKTVKDAVIRGTRDTYLVGAKKGQQMNLKITSLENNGVFDIISPTGKTLEQEATNWNGTLPVNGDYQIVVGGTRGNATYKLSVEIK